MFVDYLVMGIPGVGYGDLYKGRVEIVQGARGRLSNDVRAALLQDLATQLSSAAGFAHRRPNITLTMPARFSRWLHKVGQRRIAEARRNGNSLVYDSRLGVGLQQVAACS